MNTLTITDSASYKLQEVFASNADSCKLRISVQGGGCSGFQYSFNLDFETPADDDIKISTANKGTVVIDSMSLMYLQGATLDYKEELFNSGFELKNPNAVSTCGCGSSFSVL